jgi:phosphatidylglycerophosphatase A
MAFLILPSLAPDHIRLVFIALTLVASVVGFAVCPAAVRHFGAEDPSAVVIDEVAGVWIALAVMPPAALHAQPAVAVVVAVLFFRVFDIAKPWPVDWLERRPGPASIMYDDLAAGLLAGVVATAILA